MFLAKKRKKRKPRAYMDENGAISTNDGVYEYKLGWRWTTDNCSNGKWQPMNKNRFGGWGARIINPHLLYIDIAPLTKITVRGKRLPSDKKGITYPVISWQGLLADCDNLKTVDCSRWDSSRVADTSFMFANNRQLKSVILNNIDFSHVVYTTCMFFNSGIEKLLLGEQSFLHVTSAGDMFGSMPNLNTLDISNWSFGNQSYDYNFIIKQVPSLQLLIVKDEKMAELCKPYIQKECVVNTGPINK